MPDADDFKAEILRRFSMAQARQVRTIDIKSGDIHRALGGYPEPNHRMPVLCQVMYDLKRDRDIVIYAPPEGKGATLIIRYALPR